MSARKSYCKALYRGNGAAANDASIRRIMENNSRDTLRLLTCGSVDDGKSTLIGRMLYESQQIQDDQLAELERASRRFGTTGEGLDFALLTDGLEDERKQGITIDVGYRFFLTAKRAFIVADTPGHEQYTRNVATGASNCELAILLLDARKGLLRQTKRHAAICSLLGIRHIVLAINKIDLVGYDEGIYRRICTDFAGFAKPLAFQTIWNVPISARYGDNLFSKSSRTAWYMGEALLPILETLDLAPLNEQRPLRLPVQLSCRPNPDFRGYAGSIASGCLRTGDPIVVVASGITSNVARILGPNGDIQTARAGDAVTVSLADDIDVSRGDVICTPNAAASIADQFRARVIWLAPEPLFPGRQYIMRIGMRYVSATVTAIRFKLEVETLAREPADELGVNEIAECNISTAAAVEFDSYEDNPSMGGFILIDRSTNATVGMGMIRYALRRATNIRLQRITIDKAARAGMKFQKPAALWFTGYSGTGKSTIADLVERKLYDGGYHTYQLDGDNVRHGLNRDLGFTEADRIENIRRIGEIAKLMIDAGLIVLCSFISPFAADRQMVREKFAPGEFLEIFVDTPLDQCIARDPKGLYAKAQRGEIHNLTGIGSPYEPPQDPELRLETMSQSPQALAEMVHAMLQERGIIRALGKR